MKILLTLALTLILYPYPVMALPAGGRVAAGSAGISKPNRQNLNINQLSDKAIINWKGFSINVNELVRFIQPSSKSIVLNRVTGVDPSSILGQLVANGRVFIINPNGILFGPNSVVDVAGLLATTLNIKDADFIAGKFNFSQAPGQSPSYVINQGQIRVSDNGFVFLVASGVSNEGLVIANLGKVVMGSGEKLTVDFMGDGLITFAIEGKVLNQVTGPDGAPLSSAVANTGTIKADGGQVILSARASSEIFSSVVNNSGVIEARSLVSQGGVIRLEGSDPVPNGGEIGSQANLGKVENADGRVLNTGTLDVSAREAGAAPGEVTLSGQMVGVSGSILARGAEGAQGGRVLVTSSEKTILSQDSVIDTSGVGNSSAGNAVIWSDKDTVFRGTIIAKGGETGGNGGQIEVSGHENLSFTGKVNALAPMGATGSLLLDPLNITVATGGAATLPQVDQFSDTPATNQTIAPATINAAAANVTLQANNDIIVTNPIAMTNSGVGITMQAGRDINVNASVSTTSGNISLKANDSTAMGANRANATTGDIAFGAGANLSAGTGNITLTIDPSTTNPFNPGSITTVRNLTTTSGNISINSPNNVTLSGTVNAGSGTVTINANADAAGAQGFTMNAGSSITTTGGVNVNVNAAAGGTGTAALRDISTSGTLTVQTNTGGNTTGGAISQTAGTTITAGIANLSTGNGAITLNTATNDFGTVAVSRATNVTLQDANSLNLGTSSISGTLNVTTAGAITDSGNLAVTGTTTLTAGAGNDITLDSAGNNFSTVGITSGRNVTLVDSNALGLAASTVSGTLSVTTAGAITDSGNLNVIGTTTLAAGAGNDITLNNANNFSTVSISSGRNVTLNDTNPLDLGASTISGTLSVTTAGAITDSGNLNVAGTTTLAAGAGNDITLDNANNFSTVAIASGRNVTLNDTNALILGASTVSGALNVTTNGAITQSGALNIAGTTTLAAGVGNNITLNNVSNNFATVGVTSGNNVTLVDSNAVDLGASTIGGTLNVTATGAITDSGNLAVSGTTTLAAGTANDITLNSPGNNFSTVAITSGRNVALQDVNALNLGASTVSGTLNVTTGGAITDSGNLVVTGTTTLAAGAANDITFDSAGNNFSTVSVASANNVTLRDTNALVLGASTISGALNVTTNGALTQSGVVTVTGATTLASGAANNITLNNAGNNFSTVGITNGNNVTLVDVNGLDLGTSTVSGTLGVTTGGALTQSGALTVTGTTTLAAGSGNDITLANGGNNFSTVAITSGRNVALTDANVLNLGASTISGTLNVATSGAITDSGNLVVTGSTTLAAGASNDITLNSAGNNFSTLGITSGRNVTLVDSDALDLETSSVSGNLVLTTGGALTQSGALSVAGTTSFTASAVNTDILLNTQANNFGGAVSFAGTQANFRDIALRNTNAGATVPTLSGLTSLRNLTLGYDNAGVNLPTLTATGTLNVTAGGAIMDSGNLNVAGTTTLAAGGGNDITLDSAGNNFSTVAITSGRNVALIDSNALDLGTSTVSGTLNVTTGDALTQSGAVTVAGTTTVAAGAANNITLNNAANDFSTVGITSGNNVSLADANALDLGTSTISGNLNVTTAGAITDSGNLNVTGTTTLAAGAGNDVTLDSAANNFSTVAITSGRNVTLVDNNVLDLGASTISGTLNVTTNGAITQSDALNVAGTTTLSAGAGNNIILDSAGNNFSTVAVTSGGNVTLVDSNALDLGTSTISGTLNIMTNGVLTQSGPVAVAGVAILAAGAGNITLDNAANDLITLGITSANNVTLRDSNNISLGSSTVAGNFSVTAGGAILDGGGSAINITATTANLIAASNIGTAADPLETSVGTLNATTTGGGIFVNEANAVTLGNVSSGGGNDIVISNTSGNMTVNSVITAGGAVTLASPGGAIQDGNGGSNNVTANNLTVSSANGIDLDTSASTLTSANVTGVGSIDISNIGALTVTNATTANGNIALNATGGDLAITTVTAGGSGGNVTLSTTTSGAVLLGAVSAPNTVAVNSAGAITDTNGGTNNITAVTANLVAATNIGASVDPIETTVGTLNATTTVGGIFISEADAITLGNVSAGGGNSIVISNTTGDMRVDSVTAVGATVSLTAPGGGILDGNGSANNVTANSLTVTAATGIGLDTTINALTSASVTGAGSINISNNGPLSVANATTTNGSIALNATSGDLDITSVNAGGAGAGVTLSTTTSGNVNLGFVTAPDQVTITSAGAITDGNGSANNITATTANLTATTNIGSTPDPLETAVQTLNATATAGGISITEADGVTLNNIVAGSGNVTISNTTGDMIINSIVATAGGIDLTGAGSILDGNGAANNLTAVADSNLRAWGGVIGLSTDPIEVNINPGMLGVAAMGQVGGVSVDINGTVAPTNTLTLLNSPPGEVIFNFRVPNPSPINLPNLIGIAAELNPQRVNENDYFTDLLLDVLGEDFIKAQPFYCKLDDSLQAKLDSNLCTEDDR